MDFKQKLSPQAQSGASGREISALLRVTLVRRLDIVSAPTTMMSYIFQDLLCIFHGRSAVRHFLIFVYFQDQRDRRQQDMTQLGQVVCKGTTPTRSIA